MVLSVMTFWLLQETFIISPLALIIFICIGMALGWSLYAIRGYHYWYKRFRRYGMIPIRTRKNTSYVEYPYSIQTPKISRNTQEKINTYSTKDNLQIIEGIGPKIEDILNENGIYTWRELAQTPSSNIKTMLENAGKQFLIHDPDTWPKQAQMANDGRWDELKEYQDILFRGGKEKKL